MSWNLHISVQVFTWVLGYALEFNEREFDLSIEELCIKLGHEVFKVMLDPGLRLAYQVEALSVKDLENSLRHRVLAQENALMESTKRRTRSFTSPFRPSNFWNFLVLYPSDTASWPLLWVWRHNLDGN